ncbi:MAG TPA: peptidylprolyl isomerase [Thiothrix sp.]|nr:peptidylprolyl isomerase [Thiothrix sp.]
MNQWLTTKNKVVTKTTLAACLSGILAIGFVSPTFASDKVVATVNGETITESSLNSIMDLLKRSNRAGDVDKKVALDDLISTQLVLQEANKAGFANREDIKQKLKEFQERLMLQAWTEEAIKTLKISDEEIKKAYDERIAKMDKQEFKARHILVKTEDEAKALITELAGGKDFAELAKEKSTGPSGPKGGDLGWFKTSSMVPSFADAIKVMKKGDVSAAPVKTQFGFHVIKLEDMRDAKLPELKMLEPQIRRIIEQQKLKAHVDELRAKADVKVMLEEGKSPAATPAPTATPTAPAATPTAPAAPAQPAAAPPAP